jgi:hypothetical protein
MEQSPVVSIDTFNGLVSKRDGSPSDLSEAVNVYVTDDGKLATRHGSSIMSSITGVSRLISAAAGLLAVTTTGTYRIDTNLGTAALLDPFSASGYVPYANSPVGCVIGNGASGIVIDPSGTVSTWTGSVTGTSASDTAPIIEDVQLDGLPAPVDTPDIAYDNGILVCITEGVAIHSYPYSISTFDVDEYIDTGSTCHALGRVGDTTLLGCADGTYAYGDGRLVMLTADRLIKGSTVLAPASVVGGSSGNVLLFSTTGGLCYMDSSGAYKELTQDDIPWYDAAYANAGIVNMNGTWQYVAGLVSPLPIRETIAPPRRVVR